jgi:hypothetical protein
MSSLHVNVLRAGLLERGRPAFVKPNETVDGLEASAEHCGMRQKTFFLALDLMISITPVFDRAGQARKSESDLSRLRLILYYRHF